MATKKTKKAGPRAAPVSNRTELLQIRYRNHRLPEKLGEPIEPSDHAGAPVVTGTPIEADPDRRAKYHVATERYIRVVTPPK